MAEGLASVSGDNFDTFVKEKGVALVDFSATWCGPCKSLEPTIVALAGDYEGRANIGKVDVDSNSDLAATHGVTSVPTLIFFKDGQKVDTMLGAVPREKIQAKLDSLL